MRSILRFVKEERVILMALLILLPLIAITILTISNTHGDKNNAYANANTVNTVNTIVVNYNEVVGKEYIRTRDDLIELARKVNMGYDYTNKEVILLNDIDCFEINPWIPIGNDKYGFNGIFNGNGHEISDIRLDGIDGCSLYGLFGSVGHDGIVENLKVSISAGTITTGEDDAVGGVAAVNYGKIKNCSNMVFSIMSSNEALYLGGIVGKNEGTIERCVNNASVTGNNDYTGGIVGLNIYIGGIRDCINEGQIIGGSHVGGIVGFNQGTIVYCRNMENVTVRGKFGAGGIAGGNDGDIGYCINEGNVNNDTLGALDIGEFEYGAGGIVGLTEGGNITACENRGDISGERRAVISSAGGIVGSTTSTSYIGTINNCVNKGIIDAAKYVGGIAGNIYFIRDSENRYKIYDCINDGNEIYIIEIAGGIVGRAVGVEITNCRVVNTKIKNMYNDGVAGSIVGVEKKCVISDCVVDQCEFFVDKSQKRDEICYNALIGFHDEDGEGNNNSFYNNNCYFNVTEYELEGKTENGQYVIIEKKVGYRGNSNGYTESNQLVINGKNGSVGSKPTDTVTPGLVIVKDGDINFEIDYTRPVVDIDGNWLEDGCIAFRIESDKLLENLSQNTISVENGTIESISNVGRGNENYYYTVKVNPTVQNGTTKTIKLELKEGTLRDESGLYSEDKVNNTVEIDREAPRLSSIKVTSPAGTNYESGATITIEGIFSEKIEKKSGESDPSLTLLFGGQKAKGTVIVDGITNNKITWKYTIVCGDEGKLTLSSEGIDISGLIDESGNTNIDRAQLTLKGNAIEAVGHKPSTEVRENVTDATCTQEGNYESVIYCSVCKEEISRTQVTVNKVAHTSQGVAAKPATCTENGTKAGRKCSVCGEILEGCDIIPAGHKPKAKVENVIDATCTQKGSYDIVIYCDVCVEEISRTPTEIKIDERKHEWDIWKVTKEATEEAEGEEKRVCKNNASHTETKVIPKLIKTEISFKEDANVIEDNNYAIINAGITKEELISKINTNGAEGTVTIDNLTGAGKIKTGTQIKLNGEVQYVVVVKGDIDGDGDIGPIDVTNANKLRASLEGASELVRKAADINSDGKIDPLDITNINKARAKNK